MGDPVRLSHSPTRPFCPLPFSHSPIHSRERTMKIQSISLRTWRILPLAALFLALVVPARAQAPAGAGEFPLKNGDTWVMVGDSITAQHLHSNYFEAFCFARFPNLTFRFRNSGVSGDQIPTALNRWTYDVARWRPNVVSVE